MKKYSSRSISREIDELKRSGGGSATRGLDFWTNGISSDISATSTYTVGTSVDEIVLTPLPLPGPVLVRYVRLVLEDYSSDTYVRFYRMIDYTPVELTTGGATPGPTAVWKALTPLVANRSTPGAGVQFMTYDLGRDILFDPYRGPVMMGFQSVGAGSLHVLSRATASSDIPFPSNIISLALGERVVPPGGQRCAPPSISLFSTKALAALDM